MAMIVPDGSLKGCKVYHEAVVTEFIPSLLSRERAEPHRCPVCYGTGSVGAGFYTNGVAGTSTANIQCRSCEGKGFIVLPLTNSHQKE